MMRLNLLTVIAISCAFVVSSCRKQDETETIKVDKLTDVKIPEGFTWESSRDVTFKVNVADKRFQNELQVIAIYTSDGQLLSKGAASIGQPFESKVYLSNAIKEVYVIKTAPDNSNSYQKIELKSNDVNVVFSTLEKISNTNKNGFYTLAGPDCNIGCTQSVVLAQDGQTVEVGGGKTICLSGTDKKFNVAYRGGGGTLRICGNGLKMISCSYFPDGSTLKLVITSSSIVTMENISLTTPYTSIENYGTLTVGNSLLSYVTNSGSLTFNQNLKISSTATNAGGAYENNGTITVNGNTELPARYSRITNNGSFTVNGDLSSSAEGTSNVVVNNCKLIVSGNYLIQGASSSTNNYAYLKVGGEMKIRNGGKLNVYSGSMINTKDITVLANIASVGSTSLIKATGRTLVGEPGGPTSLGSYPTISGALKLCATNVVTNVGTWTNGAGLGCNVDIPVSGCNPEGNGTLAVVDSDGDGIANNLDDFPTDASKAFISYYPAGGAENAGATVLFEDMWPSKGDYDMNDVVLSYNLRIITNAQNKVAAVDGTYSLRARGGTYQNGFGIEFPISRSLVSNVNGGMLESGHQKAVIILFQNMHEQLSSMNTNTADPVAAPKAFPISFTVTNGPLLSEFGLGEYNPFIWNKGNSRGHEVHLPGKTPTALANTSLFGTGDDKSVPASGKYYITASGSPWAISIPVKNFLYPQEGKDIVSAYLKLPDWIASGGTSYTDWYTNESSGYRNSGNLFIK